VLHLDTLEGDADNISVTFDPKLSLFPGENDTYFVTAEQPIKLVITTTDQTGRPSERGLSHIGMCSLFRHSHGLFFVAAAAVVVVILTCSYGK